MKKHFRKIHDRNAVNRIKCDICGKLFDIEARLKIHKNAVHNPEFSVTCTLCKAKFKYKRSLYSHIQFVHKKDEKYQCKLCDRRFHRKCLLKRHEEKIHQEKKFPCDQCGKMSNSKDDLRKHQKAHERRQTNQ